MKPGKIIKLQNIDESRGNLTVAQGGRDFPFQIARAYWISNVPERDTRGGHAHRRLVEYVIAVKGSFSVTLDNGSEKATYRLSRPDEALLIDRCVWCRLDGFSADAVCLALASEPFDEDDYIHDYNEFLKLTSE